VGSSSDASSATGTTATTIETGGSASTSPDEGSGESTGAPSFMCPPAPAEQQCDLIAQDCPADWHCVPYDTDGNGEFDATACVPLDAAASPRLGACLVPEADPCIEPGACPPDGADDTYPWCSWNDDGLCNDVSIAGYVDSFACEQGCLCDAPYDEPTDCPTPPTGTAVPTCVEEPYGVGSPTTCLLRWATARCAPTA
jgi:hypothetical protein